MSRDPGSTLGAAISTRRSLRKGSVGTAENGAGPENNLELFDDRKCLGWSMGGRF